MLPILIRDWSRIKSLGLHEHVDTQEVYVLEVEGGIARASKYLRDNPLLNPTPLQISALHEIIYEDVHPWAGKFRGTDETIRFGKFVGCAPERILIELSMLERQMGELLIRADSPKGQMLAVAFYHVRFEMIHPFADGNGRTGRAIVESQINGLFGFKERGRINREEYLDGLEQASGYNLTTLTNVFLKREDLPLIASQEIVRPLFQVAPYPLRTPKETPLSIEQEVERSRRPGTSPLPPELYRLIRNRSAIPRKQTDRDHGPELEP